MKITVINNIESYDRKYLVKQAKKNATSVGKENTDSSVSVYVDDIGNDVIVSTKSIRHSLDRRINVNGPVVLKIGEILKNSIKINELNPREENVSQGYVLMGIAKNTANEIYVVSFVVNSYTNMVDTVDVLYSVNAKTEPAGSLSPRVSTPSTDSEISIRSLLDYVNKYFPDILPEDVLKHYGHTERPSGSLSDSILFSRRSSEDFLATDNRAEPNSASSINWVYKAQILSIKENKLFHKMISEINQSSDAFKQNSDGEYMLPINNKIIFTDGNYDTPYISRIIEVMTNSGTEFEYVRREIYSVEQGRQGLRETGEFIEAVLGKGCVNTYKSYSDQVYEWTNGNRKGKNRRAVIERYQRLQNRRGNDTEGSGSESVTDSILSDISKFRYSRRGTQEEFLSTDNRAEPNSASSINLVYKAQILSIIENKLFHKMISEINRSSDSFKQNSDGEYMLPINNKIIFTDGNYDTPYISRIIEVMTNSGTKFEEAKEWIYSVEKGDSEKYDAVQAFENLQGAGYIVTYFSGNNNVYAWENGKRKGKTRSQVIRNYQRLQNRRGNDTEGSRAESVTDSILFSRRSTQSDGRYLAKELKREYMSTLKVDDMQEIIDILAKMQTEVNTSGDYEEFYSYVRSFAEKILANSNILDDVNADKADELERLKSYFSGATYKMTDELRSDIEGINKITAINTLPRGIRLNKSSKNGQ